MDLPQSLRESSSSDLSDPSTLSFGSTSIAPVVPGARPVPQASSSMAAVPVRIRRRNRMITSCLECRRRKLKCDKSHPCLNCTKARRECVFLSPALDQASQLKLTEIKEKVGSLERLLERDVARSATATSISLNTDRVLPDDADDGLPGAEDEKDLEPTPLAVRDASYEDGGDSADDDLLDLGIQIGKMRVTERIGGFFRPKISQEIEVTLSNERGNGERVNDESSSFQPSTKKANYEYLKPGANYIAPDSSFFFGPHVKNASLIDFLPSRLAADRLIRQYFTAVHPIAQTLHRPSFEKEYEVFWDEISSGMEPPSSVQAVVFAAMLSGVVSMEEALILRDFGVSKESLVDNFKLGTETALGRARFLRTTKAETLQAFVMYLIALCADEVSRAHSVLVGAAIRMAECMGLHRDGEYYGLNPLDTHVRRLIWYQLCFLDIRTCEAQGPRPSIRREDFDTKLPLNVDEIDIHPTGKSPSAKDRWTDSTFTALRFEAMEMLRTIWVDRPRIESRKISLTAVLSKIETFRRKMAAKYDHLIDERIPLHRYAKMVKSILIARLHIMTLHRYHNSVAHDMPERLCSIMMASGTIMLENSVGLELIREVQQWKWFIGAYHQYHVAFLLLLELFADPNRKEADRIWPCLDFVFQANKSESREIKARKILGELQQKTAVYQEMRRMRATPIMKKHVIEKPNRRVEGGGESHTSSPKEVGMGSNPITIGRALVPNVVYAGVSNGETLWALPEQTSPGASSDAGSAMGKNSIPAAGMASNDDLMADVDWEAFDQLFPPDQDIVEMALPVFDMMSPGNS